MGAKKHTPESPPERLGLMYRITEPAIRAAASAAGFAPGSHGLDAGCGAGTHLELLATAAGPSGRLTGPPRRLTALDFSQDNLDAAHHAARDAARAAQSAGRAAGPQVEFVRGDIQELPFGDETFDWVWCADTLWPGFSITDPAAVVAEFSRVTRPGGEVCLLYWSSQTLLPGHPVLEARLNAAAAEAMPYLAGIVPDQHHLRAVGWMQRAGLRAVQAATFVADVVAPLDAPMLEALAGCYAMLWGEVQERLPKADRAHYRRLCDPDSADFIAGRPDYYAFVTYTMFRGSK